MHKVHTYTMEFTGASYEIGYQFGKMVDGIPALKAIHTAGMKGFGPGQADEAVELFDRWCPGLADELAGFADALHVKPEQVAFYSMTSLVPRCGHVALLPGVTADGKPLVARSYEFNHELEDFSLIKTAVKGKYTHMGTSVLNFGREDGFNECGLAVTMSSCGFPVGAQPFMRPPKIKGLQYWAVIRALLENCRDVDEALRYLDGMPIAYNLNMILVDRTGRGALYETLDGRCAVKLLEPGSAEQMLSATNHAVLPELEHVEPKAMAHSLKRYSYIRGQLDGQKGITKEKLKNMLLSPYPEGLCCHYYEEYFGTTKSMVISPADGTIELCWGGRSENGWQHYDIAEPLGASEQEIGLLLRKAAPGTFDWVPLE